MAWDSVSATLDQLDADLDAYIADDLPAYDEHGEPPTLATIDEADRALRRIARVEHELARVEALAKARVEQIQTWLHERSDILLRERDWWARSAEGWMRAHNETTGTKTAKLPAGTLSLRAARPRVEALDDPAEDVAETLVRVRRSWDKKAVSDSCQPGPVLDDLADVPDGYVAHAAVTEAGERIDGVVLLVPERDSFSFKAGAS